MYLNPDSNNPLFAYDVKDEYQFVVSNRSLYIRSRKSNCQWLTSREHLLQLSDAAIKRHMVLFTAIMGDLYEDESVPRPSLLLSVLEWGDELLQRYGNDGYKSIKYWEPIMTPLLINYQEDFNTDTRTYRHIMFSSFQEVKDRMKFNF